MSGPYYDPITGRAILGSRARRDPTRNLILVQTPFGACSHLIDITRPAAHTKTLCRMLTGDSVKPGTHENRCRSCVRALADLERGR